MGKEKVKTKTEKKKQDKIFQDKTFGLKNKKGKRQQNFVKMVQTQVFKEDPKKRAEKQFKAKEEKRKKKEGDALLGFLQKQLGMSKKEAAKKKKKEEEKTEEEIKEDEKTAKINIYVEPREPDPTRSSKICDAFLEACEKNVYGWQWTCPNGGIKCGYAHCLPEGYMLKSTMDALMKMQIEDDENKALEYKIEEERAKLDVDK